MPELPEVESIRRSLAPEICGRKLAGCQILTQDVFLPQRTLSASFQISRLDRRGKYLLIWLNDEKETACLIVHLRMTGRLLIRSRETDPVKHTHVRFRLDPAQPGSGQTIWLDYVDPRRFGRIWLIDDPATGGPHGLVTLGQEPLAPDFDQESLRSHLPGRRTSLKALLLNQTVIAGLGNIYADESLFASRLHPARSCNSLSDPEILRLVLAIKDTLARAIDCNGTTFRDYADGWNRRGSFQNFLMVYGRKGRPCHICETPIHLIRLAGRATCYCPSCQPENTKECGVNQL